jgi:hypothetical protein
MIEHRRTIDRLRARYPFASWIFEALPAPSPPRPFTLQWARYAPFSGGCISISQPSAWPIV